MQKHHFTIHRNGDSAETFRKGFANVRQKARELEAALREIAPNSRNYYVNANGETELRDDANDYLSMLKKVGEVADWAEEGQVRTAEQTGEL